MTLVIRVLPALYISFMGKFEVQFFLCCLTQTIRRFWKLPHCSLLPSLNDCIPIEHILEQ